MTITKTRVVIGDAFLLTAILAFYFLTEHLTQNMLAMSLVVVILLARSIFWHINWYKTTGKIY